MTEYKDDATQTAVQEVLRLGVIGGGPSSAVGYTHLAASQMDHRWAVTAGCFSRHPEINRAAGLKWGVAPERTYLDWQQMIEHERERLDAIAVLTPTPQHSKIVIAALEAGFAVISEKALASSVEEALAIKRAVDVGGRYLAVTYNYTGYPMLREIKKLIEHGELGKPTQVRVEMPQEGFARLQPDGSLTKPQDWRLQDGPIPTLSLDLGVHLHNIVNFLTGEAPLEVVADQNSHGWFEGIVDDINCIARYSNGLSCNFWYSKSALGHRNGLRVQVYGTQAACEWFQMQPEELVLSTIRGDRIVRDRAATACISHLPRYNRFKAGHPAGFLEAFANLYVDLADSLIEFKRNGTHNVPWVFGVDHALEGLKLCDAINRSAKARAWVTV